MIETAPEALISLLLKESKGKFSKVVFNINDFTKEKDKDKVKDNNHTSEKIVHKKSIVVVKPPPVV